MSSVLFPSSSRKPTGISSGSSVDKTSCMYPEELFVGDWAANICRKEYKRVRVLSCVVLQGRAMTNMEFHVEDDSKSNDALPTFGNDKSIQNDDHATYPI